MENLLPINGDNPVTNAINMRTNSQITLRYRYFTACFKYNKIVSRAYMRVMEIVLLLMALLLFYAHIYFHKHLYEVHIVNSSYPNNCLDHIIGIWPKNGILRVEIIQSYQRKPEQKGIINKFLTVEKSYEREFRVENVLYKRNESLSLFNDFTKTFNPENEEVDIERSRVNLVKNLNLYPSSLTNNIKYVEGIFYVNYIAEYSLNKDYLIMSSSTRNRLGIPVMLVTLEPTRNKCFGNLASQFIMEYFIDYDELIMSSLMSISNIENTKGFIRTFFSEENYHIYGKPSLAYRIFYKFESYIFSFFLMILITFLMSSLNIYWWQQVSTFMFLYDIYNRTIPSNRINPSALPMMFLGAFGSIFFVMQTEGSGRVTWFYYIFIIIMAEIYYNLFSYCPTTKKHWPKFFYLYLFYFCSYNYLFKGHLKYLVITSSCLFILHSMLYFYHQYEVPYAIWEIQELTLQQHQQAAYREALNRRRFRNSAERTD